MILDFEKYNENLFNWKKKKESSPPKKKIDWREQIKGSCYINNLADFFYRNCEGSEKIFLKYFNILVCDKDIIMDNKKFRGRSAVIKKYWNKEENKAQMEIWVIDNKGVEHVLPARHRIDFELPKKIVSKMDPYGEEDWEND
jgi:hypothetical protein